MWQQWSQIENERKQKIAHELAQDMPMEISQAEMKNYLMQKIATRDDVLSFEYEEIVAMAMVRKVDCVLAIEPENLANLKKILQVIEYSSNWRFESYQSASELLGAQGVTTKLVIISHQLSIENHGLILDRAKAIFPRARFILLAGHDKDYINIATQKGFTDIVTGDVPNTPGDRPYTMLVALRLSKEEALKGKPQNTPKAQTPGQIQNRQTVTKPTPAKDRTQTVAKPPKPTTDKLQAVKPTAIASPVATNHEQAAATDKAPAIEQAIANIPKQPKDNSPNSDTADSDKPQGDKIDAQTARNILRIDPNRLKSLEEPPKEPIKDNEHTQAAAQMFTPKPFKEEDVLPSNPVAQRKELSTFEQEMLSIRNHGQSTKGDVKSETSKKKVT